MSPLEDSNVVCEPFEVTIYLNALVIGDLWELMSICGHTVTGMTKVCTARAKAH